MIAFLNCLSLCIFQLGTYFIWFDKKNIFNHSAIAFCIVSIILPSFIIDYEKYTNIYIINLYTLINVLGAIFFIIGLSLGKKIKRLILVDVLLKPKKLKAISSIESNYGLINKIALKVFFIGIIGMIFSFVVMGFVPIFSSDPIAAKFFKNEYQDKYRRVALIYRTSKLFIELIMPFIILLFLKTRSFKYFSIAFVGFLLLVASLQRTQMLQSILLALSIYFVMQKNKKYFYTYIFTIIFIYIFGSLFFFISAKLFSNSAYDDLLVGESIFDAFLIGAPDIYDHLTFLNSFISNGFDYVFGATFVGGLLPFQFKFNPSIWSLYVLNGGDDDFTSMLSGGLRLPVSIWGFVNFGWLGSCLVPFFSGFFSGYCLKIIRRLIISTNNSMWVYFFVFVYLNVCNLFVNFFVISIYFLPAIVLYFVFLKTLRTTATTNCSNAKI